ncbi:MAG TPA: PAS domain-containing protein [Terriglobales bacterium]|nr:PAS domain-containing protein [Terriglobales bacterium]
MSPLAFQLIGTILIVGGVLFFGFLMLRYVRQETVASTPVRANTPRAETTNFATAAFQGVIADLKNREKELQSQLAAEARRFAHAETLSQVVFENVGVGVIMFTPTLMVQKANPAARQLLGYASPVNMSAMEVFRGLQAVDLPSSNGAVGGISQAIRDVLATGVEYRDVPAMYAPPSGAARELHLSLLPIRDTSQLVTVVVCLLS